MANLFKEAKRGTPRPCVLHGNISTGTAVEWSIPDGSGMCKAQQALHSLDVWMGVGAERVEYQLQLSEDEMLRVCAEWLARLSGERKRSAGI